MKNTEVNRTEHIFNPWWDSRAIWRRSATQEHSKHSVPLSNSALSLLRAPQINRAKLISDRESHLAVLKSRSKAETPSQAFVGDDLPTLMRAQAPWAGLRRKAMAVKLFDTGGKDTRDQSRFHVKMIMGTRHVVIVDTKYKPLTRVMKLDVSPETISEANFANIFAHVVAALSQSGNMADDESAACITFPAGTIQIEVPLKGQA